MSRNFICVPFFYKVVNIISFYSEKIKAKVNNPIKTKEGGGDQNIGLSTGPTTI